MQVSTLDVGGQRRRIPETVLVRDKDVMDSHKRKSLRWTMNMQVELKSRTRTTKRIKGTMIESVRSWDFCGTLPSPAFLGLSSNGT